MKRAHAPFAAALAASLWATACAFNLYLQAPASDLAPHLERAASPIEIGQARFLLDDTNGLSTDTLATSALPWKVVTAALVLDRKGGAVRAADRDAIDEIYQSFGFMRPARIANWAGAAQPRLSAPLGVTRGVIESRIAGVRLEVSNIACAACHAGATYDATGAPKSEAWLGAPNTSIDFDAYSRGVHRAFIRAMADQGAFPRAIETLYPDIDRAELRTIEKRVLPAIAERLARIEAAPGRLPLNYPAGGPGMTNGVGALKNTLGILDPAHAPDEHGYTSIPDLVDVAMRSSLLADGAYAAPGSQRFRALTRAEADARHLDGLAAIVATFPISSMGAPPRRATQAEPRVRAIMDAVAAFSPQRFPGPIDRARALRGAGIYARACASCHGVYSAGVDDVRMVFFPNRLVPRAAIGTDGARLDAISPGLVEGLAHRPLDAVFDAAQTRGYVAPRLAGLWASAPYLHNGSVPTLWHLMHPEARPAAFEVGGHRLDFGRVGIDGAVGGDGVMRYPSGYRPWSTPAIYDTRAPGRFNGGHERPFAGLSEEEKAALLEYLKLL